MRHDSFRLALIVTCLLIVGMLTYTVYCILSSDGVGGGCGSFDIKPPNILLHQGRGILGDCGLAKPMDAMAPAGQQTRFGAMYASWHGAVGTRNYIDPQYQQTGFYKKECE